MLERLLERGEDVVGVFCAPDREGRPTDPLKEVALERGLPVHQPTSWKTDEALALMRSFEPDLCVMAYVTLLVPQRVLDAPKLGTIQYHPSLLPKHRGPSSINWPIIQGESRTGITIFWPDEALDEGPILLQKEVAIGPHDTLGSLYFDQLFPLGRRRDRRGGRSGARRQGAADPAGRQRSDLRELVPQGRCADRLEQARGRGLQPDPRHRPAARRLDADRRQRGADLRQRAEPAIGRARHACSRSPTTASRSRRSGGSIVVKRVRAKGGKKVDAGEFAREVGLRAGKRVGA